MCINLFFLFIQLSALMEQREKEYSKMKFAAWFRRALKDKKRISTNNKTSGIEDIDLIESMRQLKAASGLSYTIIQTSSVGKRDIQFTTLLSILDSMNIKFSDFAYQYENITAEQIKETFEEIKAKKKPVVKKE